jgi:hypothetical protein
MWHNIVAIPRHLVYAVRVGSWTWPPYPTLWQLIESAPGLRAKADVAADDLRRFILAVRGRHRWQVCPVKRVSHKRHHDKYLCPGD